MREVSRKFQVASHKYCRMHYRAGAKEAGLPEGEEGEILMTHKGKRLVRLDSGRVIVCPMWNAVPRKKGVDGKGKP